MHLSKCPSSHYSTELTHRDLKACVDCHVVVIETQAKLIYRQSMCMDMQEQMNWLSRQCCRFRFTCACSHLQVSKRFFLSFFLLRSPAISLGFTTFGWDFCVCDRFFNPTIKVVTFRLCGWCVLGVFLLPAFTRLGHERQDLLSLCDEMHVCTD